MNNQELYKQIIMDHYNNPKNKVDKAPEGYEILKGINPSCGDELEIYLKMNGDIIEDIKYNGSGCSICCASSSIITLELKNKTKEEVQEKINNFNNMLKGEKFKEQLFEDAIAFLGISNFPARFKCAFLSWKTVEDIINS